MSECKQKVVIKLLRYKDTNYTSWFDIEKEDGTKLSDIINYQRYGIYLDKYEGTAWDLEDIKKLLNFLGIEYEETIAELEE